MTDETKQEYLNKIRDLLNFHIIEPEDLQDLLEEYGEMPF